MVLGPPLTSRTTGGSAKGRGMDRTPGQCTARAAAETNGIDCNFFHTIPVGEPFTYICKLILQRSNQFGFITHVESMSLKKNTI